MKKIFLIASGTVSLVCIVPFVAALSSGMCTTEYMPVCAQPPMQDCPSGMQCIQVMPQPETYGNACHMRLEGAKKIHDGACADRAVVIDEIYPGSDRDTYGCTGSAGYSWDSDLERCIRPWDTEAIFEWARKVGITTTQNPTEFKPESTITRDEAAAFLLRASEKQILPPQMITPMQYPFVDQEKIAPEFRSAVQFVHNTRIMQGDNNIFSPKNFLTHLEALIILTRAYEMGEGEVKIHPWYQLYLDAARMVGISVDESRIFLNQPISRWTFVSWIRQYAVHFRHSDDKKIAMLPFQGEWKFLSFTSKNNDQKISLPHEVILDVSDNRMSIAFCNVMNGLVEITEGNRLQTQGFASTKKYCSGVPMILENAFQFVEASYELNQEKNTLTIWTSSGIFLFQQNVAESASWSLLEWDWKLQSYTKDVGEKKQIPVSIMLSFKEKHLYTKVCNHLSADIVVWDGVIHTKGFVMTQMYCDNPLLMELERAMTFDRADYVLSSDTKMLTLKTNTGYTFIWKR